MFAEFLIFLFIGWVIVTLVGHASWLLVKLLLSGLFGIREPKSPAVTETPSLRDDIAGARRVLQYAHFQKRISQRQAKAIGQQLQQLGDELSQPGSLQSPASPPVWHPQPMQAGSVAIDPPPMAGAIERSSAALSPTATTPGEPSIVPVDSSPERTHLSGGIGEAVNGDRSSDRGNVSGPVAGAASGAASDDERVESTARRQPAEALRQLHAARQQDLADASLAANTVTDSLAASRGATKAAAGRTLAEFLADHNIRWGELLAGVLIVVCSIGLVVSLWSTLSSMHRVVPSMLFLAGNAAIFSAGLYTFFRWKLPDTSRATLLIATFLVPLGILAGLSTGDSESAVQLTDPIALVGLFVGGVVYTLFLRQSSRVLVGKHLALAMTIGIVGVAAVIPFAPALWRWLGGYAGLGMYVSSVVVVVSQFVVWRNIDQHPRSTGRLHAFAGKRLMVIGVSLFCLAVLATYLGFLTREIPKAWLPIALGTIPGLVVLAGSLGTMVRLVRRPRIALASTAAAICVLLLCGVLVVPVSFALKWTWVWAGSFSIAALWVAIQQRRTQHLMGAWTAIATIPLGVAISLSAPEISRLVFGNEALLEWALWRQLLCGVNAVTLFVFGGTLVGIGLLLRKQLVGICLLACGAGWLALSGLIAAVLTFAPSAWLAGVPLSFVVGITSLVALAGMIVQSSKISIDPKGSQGLVLGALLFSSIAGFGWLKVVDLQWIEADSGLCFQVGWAVSIAAAMQMICAWRTRDEFRRLLAYEYTAVGIGFSLLAAVFDAFAGATWVSATVLVVVSNAMWTWIGLSVRQPLPLQMARLSSVVGLFVVCYGALWDQLQAAEAWRSGSALWVLTAALVGLSAWVQLRSMFLDWLHHWAVQVPSAAKQSGLAERFRWYRLDQQDWDVDSFRSLQCIAVVSLLLAAMWGVFAVVASSWGHSVAYDASNRLPGLTLLSFGMLLYLPAIGRSLSRSWLLQLRLAHLAGLIGWFCWRTAVWYSYDGSTQLVVMTSLGVGVLLLIDVTQGLMIRVRRLLGERRIVLFFAPALCMVSTVTIFINQWWPEVVADLAPPSFSTGTVAVWWGGMGLIWAMLAYRERNGFRAVSIAFVLPLLVLWVMPLWLPGLPTAWFQAAIVLLALIAVGCHFVLGDAQHPASLAINLGFVMSMVAGLGSAVVMTMLVLIEAPYLGQFHQWIAIASSFTTFGLILSAPKLLERQWREKLAINATAAPLVLAAPLAVAFGQWTGDSSDATWMVGLLLTFCAVVVMVGAAYQFVFLPGRVTARGGLQDKLLSIGLALLVVVQCLCYGTGPFVHVGLLTATMILVWVTGSALLGSWEDSPGIEKPAFVRLDAVARWFATGCAWFGLAAGAWFVIDELPVVGRDRWMAFNAFYVWFALWCILWRFICVDPRSGIVGQLKASRPRWLAMLVDTQVSVLVLCLSVFELFVCFGVFVRWPSPELASDGWCFVRQGLGWFIVVSAFWRRGVRGAGEVSGCLAMVLVGLFSVRVASLWTEESVILVTVFSSAIALLVTVAVYASSLIALVSTLVNRIWSGFGPERDVSATQLVDVLRMLQRQIVIPLVIVVSVGGNLLISENGHQFVPFAIGGVAMLGWAIAELADRLMNSWQRYVSVLVGLLAIAMWSSVNLSAVVAGWELAARWFISWSMISAVTVFAVPRLVAKSWWGRWEAAVRFGGLSTMTLSGLSLVALLVIEFGLRMGGQTDMLIRPIMLAVAGTLVSACVLCTGGAVFSGPGFRYAEIWKLTDRKRTALVIGAQMFGGLAWFHLFLCRSPLASLGLRPYWPYVVMALAFASAGVVQWAMRRDDKVLVAVMRKSVMYLPLIPVIGFWISGSVVTGLFGQSAADSWSFIEGRVSYQALLIVVTLYYSVVSFMWKNTVMRMFAIVGGNATIWVVLAQAEGWSLWQHPQAWLIPPALCVLVGVQFYRHQLGVRAANAIRYAATSMIYILSSADMFIQGLGESILGPMVLVGLALIGVAFGIACKVRPFVYLGTLFVFLGTVSMVWHAQQQIQAVWPWWVFGISTGIVLLVLLTLIEKNKQQFRQFTRHLQKWEG